MEYQFYKGIPNSLRQYREAVGLSQDEVAALLGLKHNTLVSRWEQGVSLPSLVSAIRLSKLYKTSIENLFPRLLDAV